MIPPPEVGIAPATHCIHGSTAGSNCLKCFAEQQECAGHDMKEIGWRDDPSGYYACRVFVCSKCGYRTFGRYV